MAFDRITSMALEHLSLQVYVFEDIHRERIERLILKKHVPSMMLCQR